MFIGRSAEDYQRELIALQPPGTIWNTDPESNWGLMLLGLAQEYMRVDQRGYDVIAESLYSKTDELLEEHEYDFGLPDPGYTLPSIVAERRALVNAKAVSIGRLDAGYFEDLALELGYTVTIVQHQPAWCGYFTAGSACGTQTNIFFFHVYIDFQHGNGIVKDISALMFQIDRQKPGHMIALYDWYNVEYSRAFDSAFDSGVYNDNAFYPGSFNREFDSSFRNAYDYDGKYLVGAFSSAFSLAVDAHIGGGFYKDNFSSAFRRPA